MKYILHHQCLPGCSRTTRATMISDDKFVDKSGTRHKSDVANHLECSLHTPSGRGKSGALRNVPTLSHDSIEEAPDKTSTYIFLLQSTTFNSAFRLHIWRRIRMFWTTKNKVPFNRPLDISVTHAENYSLYPMCGKNGIVAQKRLVYIFGSISYICNRDQLGRCLLNHSHEKALPLKGSKLFTTPLLINVHKNMPALHTLYIQQSPIFY